MASRKQHKTAVITTAAIILMTVLIVRAVAKRQPQLTVLTSESSQSKLIKNVWSPFEKKANIKVEGNFKSTSSLQKTIKRKDNKTDVAETSQGDTVIMNNNNQLEKIDFKKLRNFKYLSSDNQKLAKETNSIPYTVATTNVIYDPKTAKGINFTGELWDQANFRKIGFPSITMPFSTSIIYIGNDYMRYRSTSSYVGYSIDDNGRPAFEALKLLQPNVKIYRSLTDLKKQFATKQINMAIVDSTTAITMIKADPTLKYEVWGPGNYANYQMVSILKGTKNKAAAYKYLDNRIAQSVQKKVSETMYELPVNQAAQRTDQNFSTYGSDDLVTLDYEYMNQHQADFTKQWKEIFG